MTAKDVIKHAVMYIGEWNLLSTTTLGGSDTPDDQQKDKLEILLTCVNDVVETLALMYFPLKYEEKVQNNTGFVSFSELSKDLVDLIKVVDKYGYELGYDTFPTYFEAPKGEVTVVYNYAPAEVDDFTDTLEVAGDKVTLRLLSIGVASRYFLIMGMYSDAEAWQTMFERAILVASRPKTAKFIKKRRWF